MRMVSKALMMAFVVCTFVAAQASAAGGNVAGTSPQPKVSHSTAMPSQGAGKTTPGMANGPAASAAKPEWLLHPTVYQRASQLLGRTVVDRNSRKVGTIKDLIFNKDGHIDYVILAHGGLLGMDQKLVPIPWAQVASEGALRAKGHVALNVSKEQLANAPRFAKAKSWIVLHEPDEATAQFFHKVQTYFGGTGMTKTAMGKMSGSTHKP